MEHNIGTTYVNPTVKKRVLRYVSEVEVAHPRSIIEVHQEFGVDNTLALLGNIYSNNNDQLICFLKHMSRVFDRILYIPGTKECSEGYKPTTELSNLLNQIPNVILLDNKCLEFDDLVFIGSPFWRQYQRNDENFLLQQINTYGNDKKKPIILLTHHNNMTSNMLSYRENLTNVKLWLMGNPSYNCNSNIKTAYHSVGSNNCSLAKFNKHAYVDLETFAIKDSRNQSQIDL